MQDETVEQSPGFGKGDITVLPINEFKVDYFSKMSVFP